MKPVCNAGYFVGNEDVGIIRCVHLLGRRYFLCGLNMLVGNTELLGVKAVNGHLNEHSLVSLLNLSVNFLKEDKTIL